MQDKDGAATSFRSEISRREELYFRKRKKTGIINEHKENLGDHLQMFIILILVMVPLAYTDVKNYQVLHC